MPRSRPDDITPVEVPFAQFEGATDPRLKGASVDTRVSGTEQQATVTHDSERPVLPRDASFQELSIAFQQIAQRSADTAAQAVQERKRSNDLLEVVNRRLALLTEHGAAPRGYWLLIAVVVVLAVLQVFDIMQLHHLMQLIER